MDVVALALVRPHHVEKPCRQQLDAIAASDTEVRELCTIDGPRQVREARERFTGRLLQLVESAPYVPCERVLVVQTLHLEELGVVEDRLTLTGHCESRESHRHWVAMQPLGEGPKALTRHFWHMVGLVDLVIVAPHDAADL